MNICYPKTNKQKRDALKRRKNNSRRLKNSIEKLNKQIRESKHNEQPKKKIIVRKRVEK